MFAAGQGPITEGFLDIWARWDARHFVIVAELGWVDPDVLAARPAAFFPLYPLAIRALIALGITPVARRASGRLDIATWVACAFLIKLAEEELGGGAGRRAALYLLVFPTAVFLAAPYSEALFLAGAIPAFYFARRGRWLAGRSARLRLQPDRGPPGCSCSRVSFSSTCARRCAIETGWAAGCVTPSSH